MSNASDGRGLELTVAAGQKAGIQRFLLVSAFPEASRGKKVSETFENYMAVKKLADVHVADTDLDRIIFRPGTLLDAPGTGKGRAGLVISYGDVTRDDGAESVVVVIAQLEVERTGEHTVRKERDSTGGE